MEYENGIVWYAEAGELGFPCVADPSISSCQEATCRLTRP